MDNENNRDLNRLNKFRKDFMKPLETDIDLDSFKDKELEKAKISKDIKDE